MTIEEAVISEARIANRAAETEARTGAAPIWLIRHGQTDANLLGRYQGHLDIPLNATGREQVQAMGEQLREEMATRGIERVQALYSSDLGRAWETAQAAAAALGLPVQRDERLREIYMGTWEGHTFGDIREQFADLVDRRFADPMHVSPPNGETTFDVARRIWPVLDEYAARHTGGDPIVVVSHGMAIATVLCRVKGLPLSQVWQVVPGNAELSIVEWEPVSAGWEDEQEALHLQ